MLPICTFTSQIAILRWEHEGLPYVFDSFDVEGNWSR